METGPSMWLRIRRGLSARPRLTALIATVAGMLLVVLLLSMLRARMISQVTAPLREESGQTAGSGERVLDMVTLLPHDGIPAVYDPRFLSAEDANAQYTDDEPIIGVMFNGEARAYSIPYLSQHEVIDDTVGGVKIAVTW